MNQFQADQCEPQVQEQGAVSGHPGHPQGVTPVNPPLNPANLVNF